MFLESTLHQYVGSPVVALDLCAAPGGKSTLLRSSLPEGSLLIANEVMRNRSQILAENIVKWGNPEVIVTNNDPSDFTPLESLFDVILTDVPCSGEGMRGSCRRMEPCQRRTMLGAPAQNTPRHMALPETRRTADLQHMHIQP